MKEKSFATWILGLLVLLLGGLGSLVMALGFLGVLLSPEVAAEMQADATEGELLARFLPLEGILLACLLFTVAMALSGYAVMEAKKWGRNLLLGLCAVNLLWLAGDVLLGGKPFGTGVVVEAALILALLVYFALPQRAKLFE